MTSKDVQIDQFFLGKWRLLPVFESTNLLIDNFSYKIHIDEERICVCLQKRQFLTIINGFHFFLFKRRYEIRTKQQIRYYKLKHDFEIYFKIYKTNLIFLVFRLGRMIIIKWKGIYVIFWALVWLKYVYRSTISVTEATIVFTANHHI